MLVAFIGLVSMILGERLQPRFRYLLWCVVLLRLAMPILPTAPWGILSQPTSNHSADADDVQTFFEQNQIQPHSLPDRPVFTASQKRQMPDKQDLPKSEQVDMAHDIEAAEPIIPSTTIVAWTFTHWKSCILFIWFVGMSVLAVRYLYDEIQLYVQSRRWKPADDKRLLSLFTECQKSIGVKRHVRLHIVSQGIGAASVGFIRPKILLAEQAVANIDESKLRMVLLHELIHVKRHDPLTLRIALILSLIHWLNPAVWFVMSRLQRDRELACDAAVLHKLDPNNRAVHARTEYGQAVLAFAELFSVQKRLPGLVGATQHDSDKNAIARRIDMILNYKKSKLSQVLIGTLLVFGIAGFGLTRATEKTKESIESSKDVVVSEDKKEDSESIKPVEDVQWVKVIGKVIAPNDEPLDGIELKAIGLKPEGQCSGGGQCKKDGTFEMRVFPNAYYFIGVFDSKNRFTAPLYEIPIAKETPKEPIEIKLEEGTPLELKFCEEDTGKPIPGLSINLAQNVTATKDRTLKGHLTFDRQTDKDGLFQARVMPGDYIYSIDFRWYDKEAMDKGLYARNIVVEKGKPLSLEFRIPKPFVGTVLYSDGTPAANCSIFSPGGKLFVTKTDKFGRFPAVEPPTNQTIRISSQKSEQYFAWLKDELANTKEYTFHLVKPVTVTGRLLDAASQEPIPDRMLCYWKKNPNDPTMKVFLPGDSKTDKEGRFTIKLIPTLKYDLFLVWGRDESYGGGPYYPRIDLLELEPKTDMDLGDLIVDPSKAKPDPEGWLREEKQKQSIKVIKGEKKSALSVFVRNEATEAAEYLKKHQNEEPLSSFALLVVPFDKLSAEIVKEIERELNRLYS